MGVEATKARARRLLSPVAIPSWLLVLARVVDAAGHIDFLVSAWNRGGNEVIDFAVEWGWAIGILWLALLIAFGNPLSYFSDRASASSSSQDAPLDHLAEIAKHDLESPTSMIKIMKRRVLKWDLPARRSEVEFGVTMFNGNVYDILVSPATGNLTYKGQQLETPILPKQGGVNKLPRGQEYEIKLTQYVPDDLTVEVYDEIKRGRIRMFGWSGIAVNVRSDHPDAPEAGTRMSIGDGDGFTVGD